MRAGRFSAVHAFRAFALFIMATMLGACASLGAQIVGEQHDEQLTGVALPLGWHYEGAHREIGIADVTKVVPTDFRIGLPVDWETTEPDVDAIHAGYRAWAAANPTQAASTTEEKYVDDVIAVTKLLAVADEWTKGKPVELRIYARWIDRAVTLDALIRDQTRMYQGEGLNYRRGERTKIGDRDAYALRMQLPQAIGSRDVTALTSYLLTREREVWVLEFVGPLDHMDRLDPLFDEIAATFRFI